MGGLVSAFLTGFSLWNMVSAMHDGPNNVKLFDKVVNCTKRDHYGYGSCATTMGDMVVKVDFKNDGLSLLRAKIPGGDDR